MENTDLHPPDDYSHRFFIWHEWIQANGPLTAENVFDYFSHSMFYDKQSNNQVLRMQTMHTGQPVLNEAEELRRFTGVEFAVVHSEPPSLFIIHKRERLSPDEVRPIATYFIMRNRIYQSPDLYTVLSNRLLTSLYSLQSSLDTLQAHRPAYTPRTGFVWPVMEPEPTPSIADELNKKRNASGPDNREETPEKPESTQDSSMKRRLASALGGGDGAATGGGGGGGSPTGKKQQNNFLLFNAMRTTATHASTTFSSSRASVEQGLSELGGSASAEGGIAASVSGAAGRTSVTPAPPAATQRDSTPKIATTVPGSSAAPQEGTSAKSAPAGVTKKKRKRTVTGSAAAQNDPGLTR